MSEKTAIELIYEMHQMLESMGQRLEMLEKNVLILNDKANGKLFETVTKDMPKGRNLNAAPPAKVPSMQIPVPQKTTISPDRLKPVAPAQPEPPRQQNVRVFGKFLDIHKKPIPAIEVTILDANNRVVKTTRTNRSGDFNSFLPPGQYSIEFIKENMAPQFRTFDVRAGQKELEVM